MRRKFLSATLMGLTMMFAAVSLQSCGEKDDITAVLNEDGDVIDLRSANNPDNVIGRGYDVTSYYADMSKIKAFVLNYTKLDNDGLIQNVGEERSLVELVSGDEIKDIQNSLATKLDIDAKYGAFSAQMGVAFDNKNSEKTEYSFAIRKERYIKRYAFVTEINDIVGRANTLRPYLTTAFTDAVNSSCEPGDLIKAYGTHVMLGGIWGASLDYNFSSLKKTVGSTTHIGAYAEARYNALIGGVGAKAQADATHSDEFHTGNTTEKWITVGGESSNTGKMSTGDYDSWRNSIPGNDTWCDYYPGALVPISEFIFDAARKKAVEDALEDHYARNEIKTTNGGTQVTEIPSLAEGNSFTLKGGAQRVGGGDDDVNSKTNRTTKYWIDITFTKSLAQNIRVTVKYTVEEQAKNNTKLETTASFDINTNKDIVSINGNSSSYNLSGTINGENHGWINLDHERINDLKIMIDDTGNDLDHIGVQWSKITIPYTTN